MKRFSITDQSGHTNVWSLAERGASLDIGRSRKCDVVLAGDESVSRLHCRVSYTDNGLLLQDCNSRNGVYADGKRVQTVRILPGSTYRLGYCTLRAVPEEPAPKKEPKPKEPAPKPKGTKPRKLKATPSAPHPLRRKILRAGLRVTPGQRSPRGTGRICLPPCELVAQASDVNGLPMDFTCALVLQVPRGGFCDGTCLQFRFRAAEKCHLYLLQIDSYGKVALLAGRHGNEIPAGVEASFPPLQDKDCDFIVGSPFGEDTVLALACTERLHVDFRAWQRAVCLNAAGKPDTLSLARSIIAGHRGGKARWSCALLRFISRPR